MNQRRRYRNPPIEEAVCEFRFQPDQDWNLTIPGKLHVELGEEYNGKPQEQKVVNVTLDSKEGRPPSLSYGEGLAKTHLVTPDGTRQIGVGKNLLSVHMMRPYQSPLCSDKSGWDEFLTRIQRALHAYWNVVDPKGVNKVGIRYINKIVIPRETVRVEEYLKCALPDVDGLPDWLSNFMSRVEYFYEDGVRLVLSQGTTNAPGAHVGFLLDLDVIWETTEPVVLEKALVIAGDLRAREREAFETVITDKARELFDAH